MKKVINIYYSEEQRGDYETGLVFELEDGTQLKQCGTDPIQPFVKALAVYDSSTKEVS